MRVQQRKFVVKAGMIPQDVINSNSATACRVQFFAPFFKLLTFVLLCDLDFVGVCADIK